MEIETGLSYIKKNLLSTQPHPLFLHLHIQHAQAERAQLQAKVEIESFVQYSIC